MRPVDALTGGAVIAASAFAWTVAPVLPTDVTLGQLALASALALLGLAVFREFAHALLPDASAQGGVRGPCCLLLAAAALCVCAGLDTAVVMSAPRWTAVTLSVLGAGFVLQDFIVELRPLRLHYRPGRRSVPLRGTAVR